MEETSTEGIYRLIEPLTEQQKIDLISRISLDLKYRLRQRKAIKSYRGILSKGIDPTSYQRDIRAELIRLTYS